MALTFMLTRQKATTLIINLLIMNDLLKLKNVNLKYHNFFNGGEQNRIHLVACVLESPFK